MRRPQQGKRAPPTACANPRGRGRRSQTGTSSAPERIRTSDLRFRSPFAVVVWVLCGTTYRAGQRFDNHRLRLVSVGCVAPELLHEEPLGGFDSDTSGAAPPSDRMPSASVCEAEVRLCMEGVAGSIGARTRLL